MSNNVHIGVCRLCGRNKELTFEHVPPASAFNNEKVKMIPGDEVIKQISNSNIEPWDLSKSHGKYQQRGRGRFYLCADCNSKTGQWYVPQYMEFVHGICRAMYSVKEEQLVLLGEDGAPFLDMLKDKTYLLEGKAWVNNHAHILRSYYGYTGNLYLVHYLNCFDYKGYVNGTTRLKLT